MSSKTDQQIVEKLKRLGIKPEDIEEKGGDELLKIVIDAYANTKAELENTKAKVAALESELDYTLSFTASSMEPKNFYKMEHGKYLTKTFDEIFGKISPAKKLANRTKLKLSGRHEDDITKKLAVTLHDILPEFNSQLLPVFSATVPAFQSKHKVDLSLFHKELLKCTMAAAYKEFESSPIPPTKSSSDVSFTMPGYSCLVVAGEAKEKAFDSTTGNLSFDGQTAMGQLLQRFHHMLTFPRVGFVYDATHVAFVKSGEEKAWTDGIPWSDGGYEKLVALLSQPVEKLGWRESLTSAITQQVERIKSVPEFIHHKTKRMVPLLAPPKTLSQVREEIVPTIFFFDRTVLKFSKGSEQYDREKYAIMSLSENSTKKKLFPSLQNFNHDHRLLEISPCGLMNLQEACTDLEWENLHSVFVDLAEALLESHRLGFIHCDVKPANVIISKNTSPCGTTLIDWEYCFHKDQQYSEWSSGMTRAFSAIGQLQEEEEYPNIIWDWESFLHTAYYCLCHRHLPWIPSARTKSQVPKDRIAEMIKQKQDFLDGNITLDILPVAKDWFEKTLSHFRLFHKSRDENNFLEVIKAIK